MAFSDENFYKKEINSANFNKIKGKSYKDSYTIPLAELNFIHILHIDVEGYKVFKDCQHFEKEVE